MESFSNFLNSFISDPNDDASSEGGGFSLVKSFRKKMGLSKIIFFDSKDLVDSQESDVKNLKSKLNKNRTLTKVEDDSKISKKNLYKYIDGNAYSTFEKESEVRLIGSATKRSAQRATAAVSSTISSAAKSVQRGTINAKDAVLFGPALNNFKGLSTNAQLDFLVAAMNRVIEEKKVNDTGMVLLNELKNKLANINVQTGGTYEITPEDLLFEGGGDKLPEKISLKRRISVDQGELLLALAFINQASGLSLDSVLIIDEESGKDESYIASFMSQ